MNYKSYFYSLQYFIFITYKRLIMYISSIYFVNKFYFINEIYLIFLTNMLNVIKNKFYTTSEPNLFSFRIAS